MNCLALDLGASGGKILSGRFDGKTLRVSEIHRFHNEPIFQDGHLVWDIHKIYQNLLDGLRKAARDGFSSLGIDSFSNDYGLLDAAGNLLSPVYMYRDKRTLGIPEQMDRDVPAQELYRRTGCQRARFNTLVQLVAQKKNNDSELNKAVCLLFVPDLINHFLCGEKRAEYTISSVSQIFNRDQHEWDADIIRAFHLPGYIFPQVVPESTIIGQAKNAILDQISCGPFSICTVGHHDTASAVAAVPSQEQHFAYISSGTWSLMGTETDSMITSDKAFQQNFANEGGVGGRNRFLKNIMGLWLQQEAQRDFAQAGIQISYDEMDSQANTVKPFRSIIDPDATQFFEPGEMVAKIQSQCKESNQPVPATAGEITRCIKESLALAYRHTLENMEQLTGFSIPAIHILGGGGRSVLLNQFTASALTKPVHVGPIEAAAIGNLCAQLIAAGELSNLDEARQVICNSFEIQEYQPEEDPSWDDAYLRFQQIKKNQENSSAPK